MTKVFAPVIFLQTVILLLSDVVSISFAFELGNMTDSIIAKSNIPINELVMFLSLLLVTLFVIPILTFCGNRHFFIKSIQQESIIFENIMNQRPVKILCHESGSLSEKIIDDCREVRWAIVDRICYGTEFLLMPFALFYIAYKTNIILTILIIMLALIRIWFSNITSKIVSQKKIESQNKNQELNNSILNASKCHDFIYFNNYSNKIISDLSALNDHFLDNEYCSTQLIEQKFEYLFNVINIASYIGILICGAILETKNIVGLGTVITLVYIYQFLSKELENIAKYYESKSFLKEILNDMETYTGSVDISNGNNMVFNELTYNTFTFHVDDKKQLNYKANCIKTGSKCAIIGENGTGKTTLLKLLLGIKEERDMEYKINNSTDIRSYLKSNATYLDSDSFLACPSVNAYLTSTGAQYEKIKELCHQFEIENLLDRKGTELSGGERKRIDFVHMLLEKRDLVLIDEPEMFLDTKWKASIINALKASERTVIFTTHDQDFIQMADVCISI